MKLENERLRLSASDLANHLGCRHLSYLDLRVARGELKPPGYRDPAMEALQQRGFQHERGYVEHLRSHGLSIVELPELGDTAAQFEATCAAMNEGPDAIVQATLLGDGWLGRADVLLRVQTPSKLGAYAYEIADTKLARETRGRTILQLCLYSDLLGAMQGALPEFMYVVSPGRDYEPESYRVDDYMAYYRLVRGRLLEAVGDGTWDGGATYPDTCDQCEICRWWKRCDDKRHADDHLRLVAGISTMQIRELQAQAVDTLTLLATATMPLDPPPERGAPEGYERVHHQARVQLEGRTKNAPVHELLPLEEGFGLHLLPEPSPQDLFFDFEGARFVGEHGLEYLFGYVSVESGSPVYHALWALDAEQEKTTFERFIDEAIARWEADEGFHIYHYAPYEPAAIKRLMGRYATREEEVDRLLRGERFVDLYAIVKHAVRASVESYSIKDLEPFFGFERRVDLREASHNLQALEYALEFEAPEAVPAAIRQAVQNYNEDDCRSTLLLRDWLEGLRAELVHAGEAIPRPELKSGDPSEALDEVLSRTRALAARLTEGIPVDREERTSNQQAQWILAQLLEWHRREDKAIWWEYFRLLALSDEELLEEHNAIGCLRFVERVEETPRGSVVDRYRFPHQEIKLRAGNTVLTQQTGTRQFAEIVEIDPVRCLLSLKKGPSKATVHPPSVFAHDIVGTRPLRDALFRIGEWVAEHGIDAEGPYRAGRDLLLRIPPRLRGSAIEGLIAEEETALEAAKRLVLSLDRGLLPIQGPPGAGKTYTGGRMIVDAVREGLKVGITAVSHKVIRNLLEEAVKAAGEAELPIRCVQKDRSDGTLESTEAIEVVKDNGEVFAALASGEAQVAAGTAWLWSREEAAGAVDVLFVDEAGQISLANALAVSQAARSVVLLGDPQQLEQPKRGSHPDGTDVSALEHLLGGHKTMPADRGLFLATTWRLHPEVCAFTSELFYESRLHANDGLERQAILGPTQYAGSGLHFVPVEHEGNCNESPEEAEVVARLVRALTADGMQWTHADGETSPLTLDDVLVVAPYNAHVAAILEQLPDGARVGTVDRFQGQEAPIVIYSMATSSPELAPRGMEFLYSLSRLNVATSRARCACILIANPQLFEPECRTPAQMKLANAFCRYLEMARGA
jgi:uncharacterized protein